MGYVNTGYERGQLLSVTKKIGGGVLNGYPKEYSILNSFGAYPTITTQEFQELSSAAYNQRLSDFKVYVEGLEGIVNIDSITELGYEAYKENLTACPL